ncbi:MAG: pitrilysin family protein [Vicinamibacterales bacterium]|nr:pitrilysin family protein [Vicinamibacterales bacterium]
MRRLATSVLAMSACALVMSCGGVDAPPPSTAGVGLQAPNSPLVTLRVMVDAGSVDDPAGLNGLNALTAMMIGQGGTSELSYEQLTTALYPWAASISAQYDKEVTTIVGEVHRDHLEPFYEMFRDLIIAPRLDAADFERNRDYLTNAIVSTLRGNDDEELGKQTLNALLYAGHPYEATEMGTERGLSAITLDDVRAFHVARYTRDNLVVGVSGGYPDGFLDRIETDLAVGLPMSETPRGALPAPRALDGRELLLVEKDAIATAVSIGFPLDVTRADSDFYPLMVANSYFGEHRTFNGRLMNQMRGLRGLNYGDYSYIENFIQDGGSTFPAPNTPRRQQFFSIWIRPVPHHNAAFALRQAVRELALLVEHGLSESDFEATREYLMNYSTLYVQTGSRRLGYALDSTFYGTGFFVDEIRDRLSAMAVEEVNAAITRHLQADNLAIAVVTREAEVFRDALLSDEPSSVTYNTEVGADILAEDEAIKSYPLAINLDRVRIVPVDQMFVDVQ